MANANQTAWPLRSASDAYWIWSLGNWFWRLGFRRKQSSKFKEPKLSQNLILVEVLRQIGHPYGCSAGEVAIAWTLKNPAVTAAIVGGRNRQQVEGISGAGECRLSQQDHEKIQKFINKNS